MRYVKIFSTQPAPSLEVTKSMLRFLERMRPIDKDVKLEGPRDSLLINNCALTFRRPARLIFETPQYISVVHRYGM